MPAGRSRRTPGPCSRLPESGSGRSRRPPTRRHDPWCGEPGERPDARPPGGTQSAATCSSFLAERPRRMTSVGPPVLPLRQRSDQLWRRHPAAAQDSQLDVFGHRIPLRFHRVGAVRLSWPSGQGEPPPLIWPREAGLTPGRSRRGWSPPSSSPRPRAGSRTSGG